MKKSYEKQKASILKATKLSDISEFERNIVKQYIQANIIAISKYEQDGELIDPRTQKPILAEGLDYEGNAFKLNQEPTKDRALKRIVKVNEKQVEWLRKAVAFNCSATKFLNKVKNPIKIVSAEADSESIGQVISLLLDARLWQTIAADRIKEAEVG